MTMISIEDIDGHVREYFERVQQGETFVVVDSARTVGQLSSVKRGLKTLMPLG